MSRGFLIVMVLVLALSACSGKTKEELYGEGRKQLEAGNPNGAIVLLKNALEKDQNYLDARYQLALAYKASGKYEQAEKELRKVQRQDPSRRELQLELARVYALMVKPDQVITEIEGYLKTNGETPETLELLGKAYAQKNRLDTGEDLLLKSLRADPKRWPAKIALAAVYVQKGKTRDATALLTDALRLDDKNTQAWHMLARIETHQGNRDKALEAYKRITEIHPEDTEAIFKSGLILLEKGDRNRAAGLADGLVTRFPKRPEGYLLKGMVYYHGRDFKKAIVELQNSIKIMPDPRTYYYLGLSHYQNRELETALSQFQKVLDVNPSFTPARVMVSMILLSQKRVDDALTESEKVLKQNDKNALAHNIRGSALMAKGMYDEAMAEYDRAIALDPKLTDIHLKKGLYYLGKGMPTQAESELQTAVRLSPDTLNSRIVLAAHFLKQKNYQKAISVVQQGIKGGKTDAVLYNTMAGAYFSQRKTAEGLDSLRKAKEANPDYAAPYMNLAGYYLSRKEYGKALGEYQALLKRNPNNIKALLATASTFAVMGKDAEALDYFRKAANTHQLAGYLALAEYHVRKKDTGKALSVLDEAIKADPRNAGALEFKGKLLLSQKKYQEAARAFEALEKSNPDRALPLLVGTYEIMKDTAKAEEAARKIIAGKPASARGYLALASVYAGRNDLDRAIDTVKKGIDATGGNLEVRVALAKLYETKRQFPQALEIYQEIQKRNPGNIPAAFAEGVVYERMGSTEKAIGKYREILAKSETYVPALNNLAYLYSDGPENLRRQALRFSARAYRLAPNHPGIMDTYGYALLRNGKSREAAAVLEKSAALLPSSPTVQYHLALAYTAHGDRQRAITSLQRALAVKDFSDAGKARQLLGELSRK